MKYSHFLEAILFLSLLSLGACENPAPPTAKQAAENPFLVRDPNYIYFKNVRRFYYEERLVTTDKPSERKYIYRLRNISVAEDHPMIYPEIIDNWFQDEAYLALRTNNFPLAQPLQIIALAKGDTSYISVHDSSFAQQWEAARQIEKALNAGNTLLVRDSKRKLVPVFVQKTEQLAFRTTLKDFERLTE